MNKLTLSLPLRHSHKIKSKLDFSIPATIPYMGEISNDPLKKMDHKELNKWLKTNLKLIG